MHHPEQKFIHLNGVLCVLGQVLYVMCEIGVSCNDDHDAITPKYWIIDIVDKIVNWFCKCTTFWMFPLLDILLEYTVRRMATTSSGYPSQKGSKTELWHLLCCYLKKLLKNNWVTGNDRSCELIVRHNCPRALVLRKYDSNSLRSSDAYVRRQSNHRWFR